MKENNLASQVLICFFIMAFFFFSDTAGLSVSGPVNTAYAQSGEDYSRLTPAQREAVQGIDEEIRGVRQEKHRIREELSGMTMDLYEAYLQQEETAAVTQKPSGEEIGRVIGLKGRAMAQKNSVSRDLEMGGNVYPKETITTMTDSNVEIRFLDNTLFSQGPDSAMVLDEYVFDPGDPDKSGLSINLMHGAFRHVTGSIARQNPDRVNLESSLSIIGIRGTTTVHSVAAQEESHGVEDISGSSAVEVQDVFTSMESITESLVMVDVFIDRPMSPQRAMTPDESDFFHSIAPAALGVQAGVSPAAAIQAVQDQILSRTEALDRSEGRESSLGRDRERAISQSASGSGGGGDSGGDSGGGGGCG